MAFAQVKVNKIIWGDALFDQLASELETGRSPAKCVRFTSNIEVRPEEVEQRLLQGMLTHSQGEVHSNCQMLLQCNCR